ncbi:MAG: hypothetical protein WBE34_19150 [Candidatus Nitrosopolaris sp.]
MNRIKFLIGVTIGIMTMLLVIKMPHPVNASSCTSSAMAGGVSALAQKRVAPQLAARQPVRTADPGCSSGAVALGGVGTSCSAANNGQGVSFGGSGASCFSSNQNVRLQPPPAQPPTAANTR